MFAVENLRVGEISANRQAVSDRVIDAREVKGRAKKKDETKMN